MKLIKKSILALTLLAATSMASFAQTAEEIVANHLKAIGGEDAWKKVNSIKYTGNMSMQGMDVPLTMTIVNHKAMRMDMSIMGQNNYMIATDKEGWNFFPAGQMEKPEPMAPEQVKMTKDQLDIQGELVDYKVKGAKVEALGKDNVDGTDVVKLKYTNKEGREKVLFFDASSYYLLKQSQKVQAEGKEMDMEVGFGDYQKQPSGIVTPMSIESEAGPMKFTSIEINPKVDESIFKPATK